MGGGGEMSLEEMWSMLAAHQPFADRRGYGAAWAAMCAEKTEAAADAAAWAAEAAEAAWAAEEAEEAAAWADDWIKTSEEQE